MLCVARTFLSPLLAERAAIEQPAPRNYELKDGWRIKKLKDWEITD